MNASTLFNFLRKNVNLQGNEGAIKNAIQEFDTRSWWNGYQERVKQQRKQRLLANLRRDLFIKRFLDYLSDLTHGVKKKS